MMNGQDDTIRAEELEELEDEDEEREPHTYKVWVHIEAIDEDGEPIEPDADLPTEICEVDTLDEATDVVAKLEAVDVFAKEAPEAINAKMLAALKRVYEYEQERRQKDDHHFHEEEIDSWGELIAKAEGR